MKFLSNSYLTAASKGSAANTDYLLLMDAADSSTTKITVENFKEQLPDKKGDTYVIGHASYGHTEKDCDYLCTGATDAETINEAIQTLSTTTGGTIVLLEGTYTLKQPIVLNKQRVNLIGFSAKLYRQFNATAGSTTQGLVHVSTSYAAIRGITFYGNKGSYTAVDNHNITLIG